MPLKPLDQYGQPLQKPESPLARLLEMLDLPFGASGMARELSSVPAAVAAAARKSPSIARVVEEMAAPRTGDPVREAFDSLGDIFTPTRSVVEPGGPAHEFIFRRNFKDALRKAKEIAPLDAEGRRIYSQALLDAWERVGGRSR